MLNLAVRNTNKVIREKSKTENVRLGRSFTKKDAARLMAKLCDIPSKEIIYVLDPGAGTGILSAAIVEKICRDMYDVAKEIHLDCYENNSDFTPMLKKSLEAIRKKCRRDFGIKLIYKIYEESFLASCVDSYRFSLFSESEKKYDIIIMNPPEEQLEKTSAEAAAFEDICTSDTEASALFAALGAVMLAEGGQMCALLPIQTAYGAYLAKFRKKILSTLSLERLHMFTKKPKGKYDADILRKSMIFKWRNAPQTEKIVLSASYDYGTDENVRVLPPLDYNTIVRGEDKSILLIKSEDELEIYNYVSSQPATLSSLGLKMKTGLTLESRYPDLVRDTYTEDTLPLITPSCISGGRIKFPVPNRKNQFIVPRIPSLMQKNKNMLFIKRVPAKSDGRRFICGLYLASQFPKIRYISTNNKLNYLDYEGEREMDAKMLYGVYAVLSSILYERYCAMITSSTQINAKDYADLPMPSEETLLAIGTKLASVNDLSLRSCDLIVNAAIKNSKTNMIYKL